VSAPWGSPDATPLEDVRATVRELERQCLAAFGVPPAIIGPEPARCPACGMTRLNCMQFWGNDPDHQRDIESAVRSWEPY
jgi:hypothetical protein